MIHVSKGHLHLAYIILFLLIDLINKIMKKDEKNELSDEEVLEAAKDSFENN